MANKKYSNAQAARREVKMLDVTATYSGSSVLASTDCSPGVSAVGSGTGVLTITLDGKYAKLLGAPCMVYPASGTLTAKGCWRLTTNNVTSGSLVFTHSDFTATQNASHPTSGDVVRFTIIVQNSTVK